MNPPSSFCALRAVDGFFLENKPLRHVNQNGSIEDELVTVKDVRHGFRARFPADVQRE
jgi:hypothetical protein